MIPWRLRRIVIWLAFSIVLSPASLSANGIDGVISTPLFQGLPMKAECKRGLDTPFTPAEPQLRCKLKGAGVFSTYSMAEVKSIAYALLAKIRGAEHLESEGQRNDRKRRLFLERRVFLASIDPAVVVLVPQQFDLPHKKNGVGRETFLYSDVQDFYQRRLWRDARLQGVEYKVTDLAELYVNWLELSSVFPDVEGIEVISELWEVPVPLKDAEADPRWRFKAGQRSSRPGFLELSPSSP